MLQSGQIISASTSLLIYFVTELYPVIYMYKSFSAWSLKNYEVSINNHNLCHFPFSKRFKVPALLKEEEKKGNQLATDAK